MATDPTAALYTTEFALIAGGAVFLAGIAYFSYAVFKNHGRKDKEFKKEDLENMVAADLYERASKLGVPVDGKLRYNLRDVGTIWKRLKVRHGSDSDISSEFAERLDMWGYERDEVADDMKENGIVPHDVFIVRPSGIIGYALWMVTDRLLGFRQFTDTYIVPHVFVTGNSDGSITVEEHVEFSRVAGTYVANLDPSLAMIESAVFKNTYEQALENHANYQKKINFFSDDHSMRMQRIEKEAEEERKKYDRGTASDMKG